MKNYFLSHLFDLIPKSLLLIKAKGLFLFYPLLTKERVSRPAGRVRFYASSGNFDTPPLKRGYSITLLTMQGHRVFPHAEYRRTFRYFSRTQNSMSVNARAVIEFSSSQPGEERIETTTVASIHSSLRSGLLSHLAYTARSSSFPRPNRDEESIEMTGTTVPAELA